MTLPPLAAEDHFCPSCELEYATVDVVTVPERVRAVVRELRDEIAAAPDADLRRRPQPHVWSALEYVCHVRDVYVASTIRLYRIRTEDRPTIEPLFNDLRTERFRHNQADPLAVLADLDLVVEGFIDEHARVGDWDRT